MNLKNINNYFLLLLLLFYLVSCSNNNSINIPSQIDEIEDKDVILNTNYNIQADFSDYYYRNINFKWDNSKNLNKNFKLTINNKQNIEFNISNLILDDEYIFFINDELNFIKKSLLEGNQEYKIALDLLIDVDLSQPISIAKSNDFFYAGFGNGILIKFDETGKIYWKLDFTDLLRTPIKIQNNNIIVMFNSNRILSINSEDGSIKWEYYYELNKYSSSNGGSIFSKNNILYFIMPNSRLGAIDTIVGEKIELDFLNQIKQQNILNYNYSANIFIHENLFSFLENLNTISTYNFDIEEFSLINDTISNIDSYSFVSNALLVLNNKLLKAYNVENKKIFWQIDLSKELADKDSIVQSFIYKDDIIIFFSKGIILQLDKLNGEILFKQKLKLSEIAFISSHNENFAISLKNGKVIIYKQ